MSNIKKGRRPYKKNEDLTDSYKTIHTASEGFYKEKGSKFYAYAYPVFSEEEIVEKQKTLRKKHYDARHHVYAYRLGSDKKRYRASDDGEPANSSGPPVFGQIRSFDLTNILIVVVRYFGGTKLGVPGLIRAYKTAAADAIEQAEIVEKTENDRIEFWFDYVAMNGVMKILKDENLVATEQEFEMTCRMVLSIRKSMTEQISQKLMKIETLVLKKQ